jgi:hypothetical protein
MISDGSDARTVGRTGNREPETAPTNRAVTRDANGRWLPGHSPNPTGRPKRDAEIREAFQDLGAEAVERVQQLMRSKDETVAVAACRLALERGYGKPMQSVTVTPLAPAPDREVSDPLEAAQVYADVVGGRLELDTVRIAPAVRPQLEHAPTDALPAPSVQTSTQAAGPPVPAAPEVVEGRRARPMDDAMPDALRIWNKLGEPA